MDEAEDFFTAEVDKAFVDAAPPRSRSLSAALKNAVTEWFRDRKSRRFGQRFRSGP
jgi:hypothetical protein